MILFNYSNITGGGEEKGGEGESSNEPGSSASEAVGQKALDSAKHFGSFLSSVANKAGATITATAKQLKHTVESNVSWSSSNIRLSIQDNEWMLRLNVEGKKRKKQVESRESRVDFSCIALSNVQSSTDHFLEFIHPTFLFSSSILTYPFYPFILPSFLPYFLIACASSSVYHCISIAHMNHVTCTLFSPLPFLAE